MSGTMGRVSSIRRSAVAVIASESFAEQLKGEKQGGDRLDPVRDAAELLKREEREGIGRQDGRQHVGGRERGFDLAGLCGEVVHGCPPLLSGPPLSNRTATRA